mgnify:CR=1 FL=1
MYIGINLIRKKRSESSVFFCPSQLEAGRLRNRGNPGNGDGDVSLGYGDVDVSDGIIPRYGDVVILIGLSRETGTVTFSGYCLRPRIISRIFARIIELLVCSWENGTETFPLHDAVICNLILSGTLMFLMGLSRDMGTVVILIGLSRETGTVTFSGLLSPSPNNFPNICPDNRIASLLLGEWGSDVFSS